jgi:hypothetical protein
MGGAKLPQSSDDEVSAVNSRYFTISVGARGWRKPGDVGGIHCASVRFDTIEECGKQMRAMHRAQSSNIQFEE